MILTFLILIHQEIQFIAHYNLCVIIGHTEKHVSMEWLFY